MQHILIPTDFSNNAWNATSYALLLFKHNHVTFHFVYVDSSLHTDTDEHLIVNSFFPQNRNAKSKVSDMDIWVEKVYSIYHNGKHIFKDTTLQAPFISGLRTYISEHQITLMVMGAKGAEGNARIALGSRASSVITRVKCPVIVVPEKARFKGVKTIGLPTDFNMLYKGRMLATLLEMAQLNNASVKVLRVAQNQKPLTAFQHSNRELLQSNLQTVPHSFHVIENRDLDDAIQSFTTTMHVDMVAMIAKNLNFFQRILFKPRVEMISYHLCLPFLVLHE